MSQLTPVMESALAMLQDGPRTAGQGITLGTARALARRELATLDESGDTWTLSLPATSVPTFDDFVSATTGAVRASLSAKPETQESAQATHVVTFLDGSTERVRMIRSTFDRGEHYGQSNGSATVLTVNGTEHTFRFGPSGDGYGLETLSEYAMRTEEATEQEIADALAILANGPVESHQTSIRERVAMELHARKLAVMANAGSDTWWMLRLTTPEDTYDAPSTDAFVLSDGTHVRVYDADVYTMDSRVLCADGSERYVSVFDLRPTSVAVRVIPDDETPSTEEFVTSGEILQVLSVSPDGIARVAGWRGEYIRDESVFDLVPLRLDTSEDFELPDMPEESARRAPGMRPGYVENRAAREARAVERGVITDAPDVDSEDRAIDHAGEWSHGAQDF